MHGNKNTVEDPLGRNEGKVVMKKPEVSNIWR